MIRLLSLVVVGATACSLMSVGGGVIASSSSGAPQASEAAPEEPVAAPKPEFAMSSQDLSEQITLATKGFTPDGPPLRRSLAAFEPVPLVLATDRYYTVTVTLERGASFSDAARRHGLHFLLEHGRDATIKYPGVIGPGGFIGGDNVQTRKLTSQFTKPMEAAFEIQFGDVAQDKYQHPAQLGTGTAVVQVLSRKITKHDLDDDTHAEQVRVGDWNNERTEMKTRMCDRCERDYNMCRVSAGESHCATKYKYCAAPAREREQPTWQWCGRAAP